MCLTLDFKFHFQFWRMDSHARIQSSCKRMISSSQGSTSRPTHRIHLGQGWPRWMWPKCPGSTPLASLWSALTMPPMAWTLPTHTHERPRSWPSSKAPSMLDLSPPTPIAASLLRSLRRATCLSFQWAWFTSRWMQVRPMRSQSVVWAARTPASLQSPMQFSGRNHGSMMMFFKRPSRLTRRSLMLYELSFEWRTRNQLNKLRPRVFFFFFQRFRHLSKVSNVAAHSIAKFCFKPTLHSY